MSRYLALLVVFKLCLLTALPAHSAESLRVLTWPGYADPDLVKIFEQRFGARVEVTFVASDDQLRQKLRSGDGADFDVFAANTAEIQRYIDQGLAMPLNLARIPNTGGQLPRFRNLAAIPGLTREGKAYAVPYTYSEMGLIYDRKQFKMPPDSLAALWDPANAGSVLAFNDSTHNFSLAAIRLGKTPFRISDEDFPKATDELIALRRNVLTFYSLPEESVELFIKHKAALLFANYGSQQLKLLRDAGADVGYVIPREGALAWLDCWAISQGARNLPLAEAWINFMLEPKISGELTKRQGLANTLETAPSVNAAAKIIWLEPVENEQRRSALWRRIISGDQPRKF